MTRTWFTRGILMTPLVALASLGQAQTPAAPAPTPAAKPKPAVPPAARTATPTVSTGAGGTGAAAVRPVAPAGAHPSPPIMMAKPGPVHPVGAVAGKPPAIASVAGAAVATPTTPALKPAPELDQLKFLRGRWRCDGKQFATPLFGPEHTFTAIAEGKPLVDGFWDQYTYEERKTKDHHGLKVQGQWGWDQGAKHLVRVAATNAGDWDSGTAPGLEGDKIVWTGEFSGPLGRNAYRHVFIKKSDREWTHALELKDPTGKFTPINEVSCKH